MVGKGKLKSIPSILPQKSDLREDGDLQQVGDFLKAVAGGWFIWWSQ